MILILEKKYVVPKLERFFKETICRPLKKVYPFFTAALPTFRDKSIQ